MDVNAHPDFLESFALIRDRHGAQWAKRFVLVAPIVLEDPDGPLRRAFLDALGAHRRGDVVASDRAWAACRWLLDGLAADVVAEAEEILAGAR